VKRKINPSKSNIKTINVMKTNLVSHYLLLISTSAGLAFGQMPPPGRPPQGQPPQGQPPQGQPPQAQPPQNRPPQGQRRPSQRPRPPHQMMAPNRGAPRVGDPLPGLTPNLLVAFADGRAEFTNRENAAGGLGPIFNHNSCAACHVQGGIGGAGTINVTRFGRVTNGAFDPLAALGGSLLQNRFIHPAAREVVPRDANVVVRRQTTALFGLGLIETIPDETILAGVFEGKPDGVLGKASMVMDVTTNEERVGRFGWKAQQATLLAFSADAYLNEMGITSRFFPVENAPNGKADVLATHDLIADPEDTIDPATGKADIDHSADFMLLLAPLPPRPLTASATAGQALFSSVGCAVCHTPSMTTGTHEIAALSEKLVPLYSDLLLHDMGRLGDGIVQGDAGGRDMKTAPLWGVRVSAPYLHDGRAPTIDAAIRAHDGEALVSRGRYTQLSAVQRQQLIDFVNSL